MPKNTKFPPTRYKYKNISILLLSYMFAYSIYGESRFYENNLYEFDFNILRSYFLVFFSYFLISKNLIDVYEERSENLIITSYLYTVYFIFRFNFSLLAYFIYLGISHISVEKEIQNLILYILSWQFGG